MIREILNDLINLEFIMVNPDITIEECFKRLDREIKKTKAKYFKRLEINDNERRI